MNKKTAVIAEVSYYSFTTKEIVYIIPYHNPWQNFYDSLSAFLEVFMDERNQLLQ